VQPEWLNAFETMCSAAHPVTAAPWVDPPHSPLAPRLRKGFFRLALSKGDVTYSQAETAPQPRS